MFNNVYYAARGCLWIVPPKNASTSIKAVVPLGPWISRDAALTLNRDAFTIGVVRHPLDRLVSALYSVADEPIPVLDRLVKYRDDSHVRPQAPAFHGLRVDRLVRVEHLADDWLQVQARLGVPDLPRLNTSHRPTDWRTACDWTAVLPRYMEDFALCCDYQQP